MRGRDACVTPSRRRLRILQHEIGQRRLELRMQSAGREAHRSWEHRGPRATPCATPDALDAGKRRGGSAASSARINACASPSFRKSSIPNTEISPQAALRDRKLPLNTLLKSHEASSGLLMVTRGSRDVSRVFGCSGCSLPSSQQEGWGGGGEPPVSPPNPRSALCEPRGRMPHPRKEGRWELHKRN